MELLWIILIFLNLSEVDRASAINRTTSKASELGINLDKVLIK